MKAVQTALASCWYIRPVSNTDYLGNSAAFASDKATSSNIMVFCFWYFMHNESMLARLHSLVETL